MPMYQFDGYPGSDDQDETNFAHGSGTRQRGVPFAADGDTAEMLDANPLYSRVPDPTSGDETSETSEDSTAADAAPANKPTRGNRATK